MTTQVEGSTKGREETCRQLRPGRGETYRQLRHRHQVGPNPLEDEQLQFAAFFIPRRSVIFFSELGQVSVAWRKTSSQPTGCKQYTHKSSTYRGAQHKRTFHPANTRSSRAGKLRITHLCVPKQLLSTCHVSILAAPDTVHSHKFSHLSFRQFHQHTHKTFGVILAYMCVKLLVRSYVCHRVGPFWVFWGPFGVHFAYCLNVDESAFTRINDKTESMFRQECSLDKNSNFDC